MQSNICARAPPHYVSQHTHVPSSHLGSTLRVQSPHITTSSFPLTLRDAIMATSAPYSADSAVTSPAFQPSSSSMAPPLSLASLSLTNQSSAPQSVPLYFPTQNGSASTQSMPSHSSTFTLPLPPSSAPSGMSSITHSFPNSTFSATGSSFSSSSTATVPMPLQLPLTTTATASQAPPMAHFEHVIPLSEGKIRRVVVLWDLQQVPMLIESLLSPSALASKLRQFLSFNLGVSSSSFSIFACCQIQSSDNFPLAPHTLADLTSERVVVTVYPPPRSGALGQAQEESNGMKALFATFLETFSFPTDERVAVFLINDSNFRQDILDARMRGCIVIVIYIDSMMPSAFKDKCRHVGVHLWEWTKVMSTISGRNSIERTDLDFLMGKKRESPKLAFCDASSRGSGSLQPQPLQHQDHQQQNKHLVYSQVTTTTPSSSTSMAQSRPQQIPAPQQLQEHLEQLPPVRGQWAHGQQLLHPYVSDLQQQQHQQYAYYPITAPYQGSHTSSDNENDRECYEESNNSENDGVSVDRTDIDSSSPPTHRHGIHSKLCRNFFNSIPLGQCEFGEKCMFSHKIPLGFRTRPCTLYIQGCCERDVCTFKHE